MDNPANFDRRLLLHAAAGLILTTAGARAMNDTDYTSAGKPGKITGKGVGDFDFLAGEWKIAHRRLKDGTTDVWEESVSGATVHRVLDGMGSIEELRAPSGKFMGMGIRVWLPQDKKWADHWTGAHNGVVNPPQKGEFIDGEGVFISDEEVDGVKWLYRIGRGSANPFYPDITAITDLHQEASHGAALDLDRSTLAQVALRRFGRLPDSALGDCKLVFAISDGRNRRECGFNGGKLVFLLLIEKWQFR
jgi:hypothetical protein